MARLDLRNFPDDLLYQLEEIARRTGKSKKDVVVEALQLYIAGSASASDPSSPEIEEISEPRLTILRYDARCARCGKVIRAGEEAYLAKVKYVDGRVKWLAWHYECLVSDNQLVKLYVKRRELQKVIKALKREADRLADTVSEAETRRKLLDIAKSIDEKAEELLSLLGDARSLVKQYFDNPREIEGLAKVAEKNYEELKRLAEKLEEISAAMSISLKTKRKTKAEVIAP